jgi:hypothetical protein
LINRLVLSFVLLMGCQTPAATTSVDSEMMTLAGPVEVAWASWTPSTRSPVPSGFISEWKAFDYAVLGQPDDVERTWSAVHGVLNVFQPTGTDVIQMVMTELEPRTEDGLDVTCVVRLDAVEREGLVFRWRTQTEGGLAPQVTLRMSRESGDTGPSEIVMWLSSGANEAEGETIVLRRIANEWSMHHEMQIGEFAIANAPSTEAKIVASILIENLWVPYQGAAYLERFGTIRDESKTGVSPAHIGLSLEDRAIHQVMSDTVFPPRFQM